MSHETTSAKRVSVPALRAMKGKAQPFLALTAYSAPIAKLADRVADLVLVGDSLGMVLYGMPNTLGVTLEMMIAHGKAVAGHTRRALCVVDMPFGSYEASPAQAFENAARIIKETGAQAIKLEGGTVMAETISFLTKRGIPVLAHIGLQPQQINPMGGYRVQGKNDIETAQLMADAKAAQTAGAFAVVLEGIVEESAALVTTSITIPTIGIGASPMCDGQILVTEDVLGFTGMPSPKFVTPYAHFYDDAAKVLTQLADDIKARRFPAKEHCYQKVS